MDTKTTQPIDLFSKALIALEAAVAQLVSPGRFEIDVTIQRFEFTFELFWKTLKKILQDDFDTKTVAPRQTLQQAYGMDLISNEKMWVAMLDDRNMTSHTYQQDIADQIYQNIKIYTPFLRQELNSLISSNSTISMHCKH